MFDQEPAEFLLSRKVLRRERGVPMEVRARSHRAVSVRARVRVGARGIVVETEEGGVAEAGGVYVSRVSVIRVVRVGVIDGRESVAGEAGRVYPIGDAGLAPVFARIFAFVCEVVESGEIVEKAVHGCVAVVGDDKCGVGMLTEENGEETGAVDDESD